MYPFQLHGFYFNYHYDDLIVRGKNICFLLCCYGIFKAALMFYQIYIVHLNHFVSSFGISVLKVASMIEDEPNSEIRQKARGKQTPWKNFLIKYLTVVCIIPQKFEIHH